MHEKKSAFKWHTPTRNWSPESERVLGEDGGRRYSPDFEWRMIGIVTRSKSLIARRQITMLKETHTGQGPAHPRNSPLNLFFWEATRGVSYTF